MDIYREKKLQTNNQLTESHLDISYFNIFLKMVNRSLEFYFQCFFKHKNFNKFYILYIFKIKRIYKIKVHFNSYITCSRASPISDTDRKSSLSI